MHINLEPQTWVVKLSLTYAEKLNSDYRTKSKLGRYPKLSNLLKKKKKEGGGFSLHETLEKPRATILSN